MASITMATETVTLEKVYFETLLRRAQFHTSDVGLSAPASVPTVTISKVDHDNLLEAARQYANLLRNLYRGGATDTTIGLLIKDDTPVNENGTMVTSAEETTTENGTFLSQVPLSFPPHRLGPGGDGMPWKNASGLRETHPRKYGGFQGSSPGNGDFTILPDSSSIGFNTERDGHDESQARPPEKTIQQHAKRTILLANLAEGITHADVASAVRGGMVLDIYFRNNSREVSVSFLEEEQASEFFRYVKRHDLYIRGKRVEIRWSNGHFAVPHHVAGKIRGGATRNLVVRNCKPEHTEEAIRDDLEHIHNLIVVKFWFDGKDAHISINSVHNALFARTCMLSRTKYRKMIIDWEEDECAAPLEWPQRAGKENVPPRKKGTVPANRFQPLTVDWSEDGSEEEHDDAASDVTGSTVITAFTAAEAGDD